jgi:hypothetical protein
MAWCEPRTCRFAPGMVGLPSGCYAETDRRQTIGPTIDAMRIATVFFRIASPTRFDSLISVSAPWRDADARRFPAQRYGDAACTDPF